jgi:hypothetical protein
LRIFLALHSDYIPVIAEQITDGIKLLAKNRQHEYERACIPHAVGNHRRNQAAGALKDKSKGKAEHKEGEESPRIHMYGREQES